MNEESLFAAAWRSRPRWNSRLFLEEACAGDVAHRRRVERLLAAHMETLGILDQTTKLPDGPKSPLACAPRPALDVERVGTMVAGRYRLLEEIGSGDGQGSGRPSKRNRFGELWR